MKVQSPVVFLLLVSGQRRVLHVLRKSTSRCTPDPSVCVVCVFCVREAGSPGEGVFRDNLTHCSTLIGFKALKYTISTQLMHMCV